jgi:hypothetical protein
MTGPMRALRRFAAPFAAVAIAVPAAAQTPVHKAPAYRGAAAYEIIRSDPDVLEIRFHGVTMRGAHADDSQNALAIDFQHPVEGLLFDRLPLAAPLWISMAFCNFRNGVIRGTRPVTFLTRTESDGFSLRLVPRVPMAEAVAPPPPPMRGSYTEQRIGPQPEPVSPATTAGFHLSGEYAAAAPPQPSWMQKAL